MKIGLVGENPNDTDSIKNLLLQKYKNIKFISVIRDITGSDLDKLERIMGLLRTELQFKSFDFILYIRDLLLLRYKKIKL